MAWHGALVVFQIGGSAALFGFSAGIDVAIRLLTMAFHEQFVKSGASLAMIVGAFLNPEIVLGAIGCIVVSGVAVGAATAVPIIVIGSGGVFVSAGVFHAWEAAKRVVVG
jgi:hypothetical protein